ncbi:MAG: ATP-binding protein [Sedimentisphaerales bacterium]|nr:ATP-binding protein [Sedimentisphaerales bacterium]
MDELVIISGKGGTGKTSIAASFAVLAERPVIADCDVDAADLHLLLGPEVEQCNRFLAGFQAMIRQQDCIACGKCLALCRFEAIGHTGGSAADKAFSVDPIACEGCGVCARWCPAKAIDMVQRDCGQWFISKTRVGPMVHAQLSAASENSGKLVATVREAARQIAQAQGRRLVIVDGPPGIGCPVIASITGATGVLIVTEPTVTGEHDLQRVIALAKHFGIPSAVCVSKWDLNPQITDAIEHKARQLGAKVVGRVRYDPKVSKAQIHQKAAVETDTQAGQDILEVWRRLE